MNRYATILTLGLLFAPACVAQGALADKGVLPLEPLVISAEKRREMLARVMRIGMSNIRSDKAEDAGNLVCTLRERTGSHFKDMICGTNAALNIERSINFTRHASVISEISATNPGNSAYGDNFYAQGRGFVSAFADRASVNRGGGVVVLQNMSRGKMLALVDEYTAGVSAEENRALLLRDMIWSNFVPVNGRHGMSADDYTNFALSFKAVKELETTAFASDAQREAAMARAISGNELSIEQYNRMLELVLNDEELRLRTLVALKLDI